jgi:hypothetical protein
LVANATSDAVHARGFHIGSVLSNSSATGTLTSFICHSVEAIGMVGSADEGDVCGLKVHFQKRLSWPVLLFAVASGLAVSEVWTFIWQPMVLYPQNFFRKCTSHSFESVPDATIPGPARVGGRVHPAQTRHHIRIHQQLLAAA